MKILVVDDEKDVQVLFEQRFRREIKTQEMQFVFAFSGEEAFLTKPVDFSSLKEKLKAIH